MIAVFAPKAKQPGVVLVTEADYINVLENMLKSARQTIEIMEFSFVTGSEDGRLYFKSLPFQVMELLKKSKKSDPSLNIRVYLEGKRDTATKNEITALHLRKAGIEVKLGSTHAKCVIVDGRYTMLGSSNLTDQSLLKNFETNVLLDSPAVATQAKKYFEHSWRGGKQNKVTLKPPLIADGAFKPALLKMIQAAKTTIEFSIYFFNQADIEKALITAHKRGVKIMGLVHTHRKFGLDDVKRTRATVRRLRAAGLNQLTFAPATAFTHSKYIVVNRQEVLMGSGNWLDRDVTTHPQLYARLNHKALALKLSQHLRAQIKALT